MLSSRQEGLFSQQKMKYAKKFPQMRAYEDEVDGVFRTYFPKPCHICNRITKYREINSGFALCSEECMARFDAEIDTFIMADFTSEDQEELPSDLPFGI